MAPPTSDSSSYNTPLPPSVEKAYYRKCIQLKRRLNEVEAANDEAKVRRTRLDRGILKMRLERAFLLDELRKRMEQNVDGSEPSEGEEASTPPQDRPHRDKRRRNPAPQPATHTPGTSHAHGHQPAAYPLSTVGRLPSQPEGNLSGLPGPGAMAMPLAAREPTDSRYHYQAAGQPPPPFQQPPVPIPASPYGPISTQPNGTGLSNTHDGSRLSLSGPGAGSQPGRSMRNEE